jgi:hypothetical protein
VLEVIDVPEPPDVVGFRLRLYEDGTLTRVAVHSYRAAEYAAFTPDGVRRVDRLPNHLNPVRRRLALRAGFKPLNFGEDAEYARALARLEPREAFIDCTMYDYLFRSKRAGETTNEVRAGRKWGG